MRAYTRHVRGEEAAIKAEHLLNVISQRDDMQPTVHSYVAAMNAWAKSGGGLQAAKRAQTLMEQLIALYKQSAASANGPDEALKPNAAAYTCVLDAYARSGGGKVASESAERWLDIMERDEGVFPNVQ
eukprot:11400589-Ditylum_brightwellii.AAC.1